MKILKKVLLALVVLFVLAQFIRPNDNRGDLTSVEPFLAETKPSEEVTSILKESCFDCHSNHTNYPWYGTITPVNFWLESHINDGKKHFNVSTWSANSVKRKDHKLEELIEMMKTKEMPLESYTWAHPEANLSETQIEAVVNWAENMRIIYSLAPRPQ
ncbi:heme-binding domain-containing protein [Bizionia sp. KMM 8389]